jgi:hypothetical protein
VASLPLSHTPVGSCCLSWSSVRPNLSHYCCGIIAKLLRHHCRLILHHRCQLILRYPCHLILLHRCRLSIVTFSHIPTPVRSCCSSLSSVRSKLVCGIVAVFFRAPSGFNLKGFLSLFLFISAHRHLGHHCRSLWHPCRTWFQHDEPSNMVFPNNPPILTRKFLYYGVGSKLNAGVTRMWR